MKHTPGPWVASCRHIAYKGGEWSEDEFLQWEVDGPRVPHGRGEFFQADAFLIAAAPELLEALVMVRDADDDCRRDGLQTMSRAPRAKIDAAIAKAT